MINNYGKNKKKEMAQNYNFTKSKISDLDIEWAKKYIQYGNGATASREVYYNNDPKTSLATIKKRTTKNLAWPELIEIVEALKEERRSRYRLDKDTVLEEMITVARNNIDLNPDVYQKIMKQVNLILGNFEQEKVKVEPIEIKITLDK